jgi:hypothetical protein
MSRLVSEVWLQRCQLSSHVFSVITFLTHHVHFILFGTFLLVVSMIVKRTLHWCIKFVKDMLKNYFLPYKAKGKCCDVRQPFNTLSVEFTQNVFAVWTDYTLSTNLKRRYIYLGLYSEKLT